MGIRKDRFPHPAPRRAASDQGPRALGGLLAQAWGRAEPTLFFFGKKHGTFSLSFLKRSDTPWQDACRIDAVCGLAVELRWREN